MHVGFDHVHLMLLFKLAGRCSIAECIQYDESLPTRVHLVPRPGSGATAKARVLTECAPALISTPCLAIQPVTAAM